LGGNGRIKDVVKIIKKLQEETDVIKKLFKVQFQGFLESINEPFPSI
jgi:hypothetical protein